MYGPEGSVLNLRLQKGRRGRLAQVIYSLSVYKLFPLSF